MASTDNFWINNPEILMNKEKIKELWPNKKMDFNTKLNAISRIIILLTILALVLTKNSTFLIIGLVSVGAIVLVYYLKQKGIINVKNKKKITEEMIGREGFTNKDVYDYCKNKDKLIKPTTKNPMMNVMLPEISDDPKRESASPSFVPKIEEEINNSAKKFINNDKLFNNLGDSFNFDNSMRQFHAMPNTRIPNDQGAFADFCYGNMPSCKDSGTEYGSKADTAMCEKKNVRYTNY